MTTPLLSSRQSPVDGVWRTAAWLSYDDGAPPLFEDQPAVFRWQTVGTGKTREEANAAAKAALQKGGYCG